MAAVVLDTDVISFIFKKDTRGFLYRPHLLGKDRHVSFMTLAELDRWALARRWGTATRTKLERFLQPYGVVYADRELCHRWSEVVHQADRKGHRIGESDAWIAATALVLDIPLVTHNAADYQGVEGLDLVTAEG